MQLQVTLQKKKKKKQTEITYLEKKETTSKVPPNIFKTFRSKKKGTIGGLKAREQDEK